MKMVRVASAILYNRRGEVLVAKRLSKIMHGYYGTPGGKVDEGESPKDGCLREVYEETGIRLDHRFLDFKEDFPFDDRHVFEYCGPCDEEATLMEPTAHEAWIWMLPEDILKLEFVVETLRIMLEKKPSIIPALL